MIKKSFKTNIFFWLTAVALLPQLVWANAALDKLQDVGNKQGPYKDVTDISLAQTIGLVVQGALGLIGAIFLILMLYAGYNWMTARGDEEKVEKAKETLTGAIIGILIVVGSYAIWAYVASSLFK